MGVNLGGFQVFVTHQILHRAHVRPPRKIGGKGMAKRVRRDVLRQPSIAHRVLDRTLEDRLVSVTRVHLLPRTGLLGRTGIHRTSTSKHWGPLTHLFELANDPEGF